MKYYLIITLSAIVAGFGQLLLKLSGADVKSHSLYSGFFLYGISAVLWVYALKFIPLSKAYPFTFVTFTIVMVLSFTVLKEHFTPIQWLGGFLIVLGVILISGG